MNIQLDSFILEKPILYALDAALCALEALIKRVLPQFHLNLIFNCVNGSAIADKRRKNACAR